MMLFQLVYVMYIIIIIICMHLAISGFRFCGKASSDYVRFQYSVKAQATKV